MISRGTKVRKKLEFFNWEGWVIGEAQTRNGTRILVIEIDPAMTAGDVRIFCETPANLEIVGVPNGYNPEKDDRVLSRPTD